MLSTEGQFMSIIYCYHYDCVQGMHKNYTVIVLIFKIAIENAYMQGNHINVEVYTHKCRRVHVHCSYMVVSSKNLQQYNLQLVIN